MHVWDEMRDAYEFDKQQEIKKFGFRDPPLSYKIRKRAYLLVALAVGIILLILAPVDDDARLGLGLMIAIYGIVAVAFVLVPALCELRENRKMQRTYEKVYQSRKAKD